MRRTIFALGLLALSGCNGALPGQSGDPVGELAVLGGAVMVEGPDSYCVDASASRPARGLALLAACSALEGEGALPWRNAVIAVQVGAAGSAAVKGGETALAAFLDTDQGGALLSRSGNGSTIDVRDTSVSGGGVIVVFTDTGPVPIPGTQQAEWRGFLDINGRFVTVSLRGLAANPLDQAAGLSLLRDAMSALLAANPADT